MASSFERTDLDFKISVALTAWDQWQALLLSYWKSDLRPMTRPALKLLEASDMRPMTSPALSYWKADLRPMTSPALSYWKPHLRPMTSPALSYWKPHLRPMTSPALSYWKPHLRLMTSPALSYWKLLEAPLETNDKPCSNYWKLCPEAPGSPPISPNAGRAVHGGGWQWENNLSCPSTENSEYWITSVNCFTFYRRRANSFEFRHEKPCLWKVWLEQVCSAPEAWLC